MTFSRLNIVFVVLLLAGCAGDVVVPPDAKSRIGLNGVMTSRSSTVTVLRADNLRSIARLYGADEQEIVRLNNLSPPYTLAQGQVLQLPPPLNLGHTFDKALANNSQPIVDATPLTAVPNDDVAVNDLPPPQRGVVTSTDLAPPPGASINTDNTPKVPSPFAKPVETAAMPPKIAPAKAPLGNAAPAFSWPVNGSTLSPYGAKAGGRFNDGINIGAPLGTAVRTAAEGDVVYGGDKIAGFGNLLLIRHSGGYATTYAHLQNPSVKQGDHVRAGQVIGQVGRTGTVSTPQLHFEIRKGTAAVNPASYLP